MPRKANFIFEVRIRITEAFTLDSIVRSPRTFKPKDVLNACANNELAVTHGDPPPGVVGLVNYVMTDFFAMAHATGLYNRQKALWESLSKVNSIHVNQLSSGLMKKQPLEIFDFSFLDYKGKPLIFANLVTKVPEKKRAVGLLKEFVGRCSGKHAAGVLAFFPAPLPAEVLDQVRKSTFADDPVGKYESIMSGLHVPFDLFEMDEELLAAQAQDPALDSRGETQPIFVLVHPDLRKKGGANVGLPANAKIPKKKDEQDELQQDAPLS